MSATVVSAPRLSLAPRPSPSSIFTAIPSSQLGGAIAVNVFALLSIVALLSVILRISWIAIRRCMQKTTENQECVFFNTQLGHYAACLILAMVFNGIAGLIGFRWFFDRGITEGWVCLAQATTMQIGNLGIGYFTTAIAVHTFNSLVLKMRQSVLICRTTIGLGWVFSIVVAVIPFMLTGLKDGPIYGGDGLLCGVRQIFPRLQFLFHLLPILIASILGAILYSLIFLVLRGTLKIKEGIKITFDPNERWNDNDGQGEAYQRFVARVSRSMIWYPVAYIALLVPYAVTRLFIISGFKVPFEALVFAFVCWHCLSVVDVCLLYNTFRVLGPAFDAVSTATTTRRMESISSARQLEKYTDPSSYNYRSAWEEKVQHYRNDSTTSKNSVSTTSSSAKSASELLPLYLGREQASIVGHPINPLPYNRSNILSPLPVARSPSRNMSLSSSGLTAAPRPRRSPTVDAIQLPFSPPKRYHNYSHSDSRISLQPSMHAFDHNEPRSPSLYSDDGVLSSARWPLHSYREGLLPQARVLDGQPMLSAVAPSFPQQVYPRSPPQSAFLERSMSAYESVGTPPDLSTRQRSLLLARNYPNMRNSRYASPKPFGYF